MNAPVMENGFEVICGDCRQVMQWVGKGKQARKQCACPSEEPVKQGRKKCSPRNAKAKGSAEEREVVKWAEAAGCQAYRTAGSGAHGSRNNESAFATDVRVKLGDIVIRVESKRHAKVAGLKSLLNLMDNSDALWVREDFADAYVLMSAGLLGQILALAAERVWEGRSPEEKQKLLKEIAGRALRRAP